MSARITFDGQTWEWDPEQLMLSEVLDIQAAIGMTTPEFDRALAREDGNAVRALIWILRRRAGEPDLEIVDVDGRWHSLKVDPVEEPPPRPTDGADQS